MTNLRHDVLVDLERQGWESLCEGTGGDFYGDLMTEDGVMILVNGVIMGRDAVVASLSDAPTWDSYEIRDPQVIPLGEDASALVYRAVATRGGGLPFEALMSSSYVLIDGRPRLALYQQTTATS